MNSFAVFDVRIAHAAPMRLARGVDRFYAKLLAALFDHRAAALKRLDDRWTVPVDHDTESRHPERLRLLLGNTLSPKTKRDYTVYDLSTNEPVREAILVQLALVIDRACADRTCLHHVVLLPTLPSRESLSVQQLSKNTELHDGRVVLIIANTGDYYDLSSSDVQLASMPPEYPQMRSRYGVTSTPHERLRRKLVRRLGHFRRRGTIRACRRYSYVTINASSEFASLIQEWWDLHRPDVDLIVHISENNPWFLNAIKSVSSGSGLPCFGLSDALAAAQAEANELDLTCVLMVDVVESGSTVRRAVASLAELGIRCFDQALAGISKGFPEVRVDDTLVHGLLTVPAEPDVAQCESCQAKQPFSSDQAEDTRQIRSFDMWWMASDVGWEREPIKEVPRGTGRRYSGIPRFEKMLRSYGDWVAFKMETILNDPARPETLFAIHPDEKAASVLSQKLVDRYEGRLSVVRIPRSAIRHAEATDWRHAIEKDSDWAHQLRWIAKNQGGQSGAVIIDVFNASGTTFQMLFRLLEHYKITPYCYFPFVDRDPSSERQEYPPRKYALYQWYGPRETVARRS